MKVPYVSAVGSLMYTMLCTRPDIRYVVGVVNRYMSNPSKEHWVTIKWILCYFKGTSSIVVKKTVPRRKPCTACVNRPLHMGTLLLYKN